MQTSSSNDYPGRLSKTVEPPCLSLYQPTHRHHPDNRQDPIRFRNLVKRMEESLRQAYPTREVRTIVAPFHALTADEHFWRQTLDGLAILAAPGVFRFYRLLRPVPELVVVADSFHTKPLLRILQSADRYHILGLTRSRVRLYEGNRDVLEEVELAEGVPRTITEALGDKLTEPHLTVGSYGAGVGGPPAYHGHGSKKDEVDIDAERFFRVIDRAVLDHHSRPSGLPLMLAALPEHHALFRQISRNPNLMAAGLDVDPEALPTDTLRERAWQVVEPRYRARLAGLVEAFSNAKTRELGSADVAEVARAAVAGRVATLLVDGDRQVPGRMDPATGWITPDDLSRPGVDDLLDDVGEAVLERGGEVVIVPGARMPTDSGLAAIYRF